MSQIVTLEALHKLVAAALTASNTSFNNAQLTAAALVAAEADGLSSHGVSRVPFYAAQALSGKVNGHAVPRLLDGTSAVAVVRVDARFGFAYPAISSGLDAALERLAETGVVAVSIANSHHFGAAGYHVEYAAERGTVALGFSNSPSAIAPWGGSKGSFGTNPIAFACPREGEAPLVIDLSLSQVARGKIMLAAKRGETIPEGWAFDAQGRATTDPDAALQGTMAPMGGPKGAALALVVEILCAVLTGSNSASQASSFFDAEGEPPGIGQFFLLFDPGAFAPGFERRLTGLIAEVLAQDGARLPGARRLARRAKAKAEGVAIPAALYQELIELSRT